MGSSVEHNCTGCVHIDTENADSSEQEMEYCESFFPSCNILARERSAVCEMERRAVVQKGNYLVEILFTKDFVLSFEKYSEKF